MKRRDSYDKKQAVMEAMEPSIHISLQGKGGVGKSLISAILSQYLLSRGQDVHGIDADPSQSDAFRISGFGGELP